MDLSKVLDDVYATDNRPARPPAAPEWSDEGHLDEVFATWTPGPPAEAPRAEHEMAEHETTDRQDDGAGSNGGGEPFQPVAAEPTTEEPMGPAPVRQWVRGDDDVVTGGDQRGVKRGRG